MSVALGAAHVHLGGDDAHHVYRRGHEVPCRGRHARLPLRPRGVAFAASWLTLVSAADVSDVWCSSAGRLYQWVAFGGGVYDVSYRYWGDNCATTG